MSIWRGIPRSLASFSVALVIVGASAEARRVVTTPLGDFGVMRYDDSVAVPSPARVESLLRMVFKSFEAGLPDTEIRIMPFELFEEQFARDEAGPAWRQWLRAFRSRGGLAFAYVNRDEMREGRLLVTMWQYSDRTLIHECLHFILFHGTEEGIGNTESVISIFVVQVMTSEAYLNWLRGRPWLDGA